MNTMNNGKRPYTNYSAPKAQAPVVEKKVEEVKEVAPEVTVEPVAEEKVETPAPAIERVDAIAEEVKSVLKVVPELLNVRVAPNANAPIVGQLKKGTTVNVIEYVDDFAKIGTDRYVKSRFIE